MTVTELESTYKTLLMCYECVFDGLRYLLEHAGSELHGLVMLLLEHVHVQIIQEIVSVIFHPSIIELYQKTNGKTCQSQPSMSGYICPKQTEVSLFYFLHGLELSVPLEQYSHSVPDCFTASHKSFIQS